MAELHIEYRSVAALQPHDRNARTHSPRQIRQIADSIGAFGFTNPILLDRQDRIIAGHGRVAAAKLLGLPTVPAIRLEEMTEAQRRAYIIADNKLAENAGWDRDLLALELKYITELDISFDLTLTGFEVGDVEILLDGVGSDEAATADQVPEPDFTAPPVSRPGDLWLLGPHRLLCGDARDPAAFARLMDGRTAQMIFTDPPYNVPITGHVCGAGSVRHQEFAMASGEMSEAEFTAFLTMVLRNLADHSADGSIHYVCMDWRHLHELSTAGRAVYAELKNVCVWNKDNGGMGTFYRSKHELVFVFKNGRAPHINNFELGQHGRYRTNVWDYPGVNTLKPDRLDELRMHPTVKPVALVADAIKDCSRRGGIVLDAFAGSGTTLIAAHRTDRQGYAIELDPRYVDTAIDRWQRESGEAARLAGAGHSHADVGKQRASVTGPTEIREDSYDW
ncbi:DNA methylase N-4 [Azospirillum argentinense]|uniref:Methyltransferase n=1 Tax=Azospirillum argentinense TaxID=2970906 RepID=A0A060DNI0_9PROT|nr:DNA methyltransferase [Azospirillum argentinense]AIB12678.1 DNA methylase N-4 [Azospirillum argentinense]EZQ09457.1 DNA methylase N-4 [Azospirillum argentinense]